MATGNIANIDSTQNLLNLLTAVKGSSSSQTTTVSPSGLTALIQNALGGTQGLAQLMQGQKSAGLYNSSTSQLLTNDLVTRTAANAAAASSTTTKVNNPQVSKNNLLMTAGLLGAKSLLGPTASGLAKKYGVDQWGNNIQNSLGLGTGTGGSGFVGPPSDLQGGIGDALGDFGSDITPEAGADTSDLASIDFSSGGSDAVSAAGDISDSVSAGTDVASAAGDAAADEGGGSILDAIGSLFG